MFSAFRMRYNTALTATVMQMIHCDNVLCMTPCLCTGNLFAAVTLTVENRAANDPSVFTIREKAPTRAFSWLKAPTSTFTFKTLY